MSVYMCYQNHCANLNTMHFDFDILIEGVHEIRH